MKELGPPEAHLLLAQQDLNFMCLLWKSHTSDFSFQLLCPTVRSCFESCPNFLVWKSVTAALTFILLSFLQDAGKHRWLKSQFFISFLDVKDCYIPVSFISSLRHTEYKVSSKTLSQVHRVMILVSIVGEFPGPD